jgi:hypothetical protein
LHHGELQVLPWEPELEPGLVCHHLTPPRRRCGEDRWFGLDPSAAGGLSPAGGKRGAGLSQLYGLPHLPAREPWPLHDGKPMVLLCQIDLAAVAAPGTAATLPASGGLLVFAATDEGGDVAIDDSFKPTAVRVMVVSQLAARPTPAPAGASDWPERQPLQPVAGKAVWPQPDAALVQALGWAPEAIESYRQHLDSQVPEDAGNGHLLLGYPGVLQNNDLETGCGQRTRSARRPHGLAIAAATGQRRHADVGHGQRSSVPDGA